MQPALTVSADQQQTKRPRKRVPLSFLLAGIAILGAVIYLVYANTQTTAVYYMTVPELKQCTTCSTQSVRIAGTVQKNSIVRSTDGIAFVIEENKQTLSVSYSGVVPDIFGPDIQVVVEGRYSGSGPFKAQTLLAKCPSKFEAATPKAQ